MRCSSRSNSTAFSEKAGERRKRMKGWIQIKKKTKQKKSKGKRERELMLCYINRKCHVRSTKKWPPNCYYTEGQK